MTRAGPWEIRVITSAEAEEAIGALLEESLACAPAIFRDARTKATSVSVYPATLPAPATRLRARLRAGLRTIRKCGLDCRPARVRIRRIRREDWAESWKRHFKPIQIGEALLVRPGWSRRRARAGQAVVVLDPGLSFGTGQHPTTAFCLQQLASRRRAGRAQSCLDIGTGSGILAIAAAKLGYRPVAALDSDSTAVRVARANARRNRTAGRIRITRKDLRRLPLRGAPRFDVVCANLTADLLLSHSKRILAQLRPGGILIVAGILRSEFGRVAHRYKAAGLKRIAAKQDREWRSAAFARPGTEE